MRTRKAIAGPLAGTLATLAAVGLVIAAGQAEVYTVKKGDTLWEIAAEKLGEGRRWPEVWEKNAQLKDPNRIYPGNQVHIPGTPQPYSPPVTSMAEPPAMPQPVDAITYTRAHEAGYVSADEYEGAGRIVGSQNPSENLYEGVEVFIDRGAVDGVRVGDNFRIFRREGEILSPGTNQVVGFHVAEKGQLRVIHVMDHSSRCEIARTFDVILRGDPVAPFKPLPETFSARPAPQGVHGMILAGQSGRIEFGRDDLVFLDIGSKQGLDVGSRLAVYRKGEGLSGYAADRNLPADVMGEAIVVRVSEQGSTALLTRSTGPIHMGDRVASLAGLDLPAQDARRVSSDPVYHDTAVEETNEGTFRVQGSGLRSSE